MTAGFNVCADMECVRQAELWCGLIKSSAWKRSVTLVLLRAITARGTI